MLDMLDRSTVILVFLAVGLYYLFQVNRPEHFVPYNAYRAPVIDPTDGDEWPSANDRFEQLTSFINRQTFNLKYNSQSLQTTLSEVLQTSGLGPHTILSVEETLPFTLKGVIVLDHLTNVPVKFTRVDFMLDSLNPYIVNSVQLTKDTAFTTSQIKPVDGLSPDTHFRLMNPLRLFYPYATSDNENAIDMDDVKAHNLVVQEHASQLQALQQSKDPKTLPPMAIVS